jgi:hypothetical protein
MNRLSSISGPSRFGLVPRNGAASEVRWFEANPTFVQHWLNAYQEGDEVIPICRANFGPAGLLAVWRILSCIRAVVSNDSIQVSKKPGTGVVMMDGSTGSSRQI